MNERSSDPVDVPALAALDADLPDAAEAAERRRAARADPRAAEVLDALSTTRADLAALPEPEVPRRWPRGGRPRWRRSSPQQPSSRPSGRRSRSRVLLAVLAAAAAVAVVVVGAPRPGPPVLTVSRVDLVAVATAAVGAVDVGALADPDRRQACLRAVCPTPRACGCWAAAAWFSTDVPECCSCSPRARAAAWTS